MFDRIRNLIELSNYKPSNKADMRVNGDQVFQLEKDEPNKEGKFEESGIY